MQQPRILLVEDEPGLLLTITDLLISEAYQVETARDGVEGLQKATEGKYDTIILDVMLPRRSGMQVCTELRTGGLQTPVLMLTARTQVQDRVDGLRAGADDYLCKPFAPLELIARIEALLRRNAHGTKPNSAATLQVGDAFVDFARCEAKRDGQSLPIAGKELQLLRYLAENPDRVISREELMKEVWNYGSGVSSRTVDVHMAWLRQKLEANPQKPRYLHTVRGSGYRFTP